MSKLAAASGTMHTHPYAMIRSRIAKCSFCDSFIFVHIQHPGGSPRYLLATVDRRKP